MFPWEDSPCCLFTEQGNATDPPLRVDTSTAKRTVVGPDGKDARGGAPLAVQTSPFTNPGAPGAADPIDVELPRGGCMNVVVYKVDTNELQVWADGRMLTADANGHFELPPVRLHSGVATPVAVSMVVEDGLRLPEHVVVRYIQEYQLNGNAIVQRDVADEQSIRPTQKEQFRGKAVILPFPSSYTQHPHIRIKDVLALRKKRARMQRVVVATVWSVLIIGLLHLLFYELVGTAMVGIAQTAFGELFSTINSDVPIPISGILFSPKEYSSLIRSAFTTMASLGLGMGLTGSVNTFFTFLSQAVSKVELDSATPVDPTISMFERAGTILQAGGDPSTKLVKYMIKPTYNMFTAFLKGSNPPTVHWVTFTVADLTEALTVLTDFGSNPKYTEASKLDNNKIQKRERVLAEYFLDISDSELQALGRDANIFIKPFSKAFQLLFFIIGKVLSKFTTLPHAKVGPPDMAGLEFNVLVESGTLRQHFEMEVHDTQTCTDPKTLVLIPNRQEALQVGFLEAELRDDTEKLSDALDAFINFNNDELANITGKGLFVRSERALLIYRIVCGIPYKWLSYWWNQSVRTPVSKSVEGTFQEDGSTLVRVSARKFRDAARAMKQDIVNGSLKTLIETVSRTRVQTTLIPTQNAGVPQTQTIRILPCVFETTFLIPPSVPPRFDSLVYFMTDNDVKSSQTGTAQSTPAEVKTTLSKSIITARMARQIFRRRKPIIEGWQRGERRIAAYQFREKPSDGSKLRELRRLATHHPFAFVIPAEVIGRQDPVTEGWNVKNMERIIRRQEPDSLWATMGVEDTPAAWAAARAVSDLTVDVSRSSIAHTMRLVASGEDIVKRRAELARQLLIQVKERDFLPYDDEAWFHCLPGGADAYRLLLHANLLQKQRDPGSTTRVYSYECREIMSLDAYYEQPPEMRAVIEFPTSLRAYLADAVDAFGKIATAPIARSNGLPSIASLETAAKDAQNDKLRLEFAGYAETRYEHVLVVVNLLDQHLAAANLSTSFTTPLLRLVLNRMNDTHPLLEDVPDNTPTVEAGPFPFERYPQIQDMDAFLKMLKQRSARFQIPFTDVSEGGPILPADDAAAVLTDRLSAQASLQFVVPIAAGDFWYHHPYAFPRSGAFLFDLVPVLLTLLEDSIYNLDATLPPVQAQLADTFPEVRETDEEKGVETIRLKNRVNGNGELVWVALSSFSDYESRSSSVGSILFNAERIVQSVLLILAHSGTSPVTHVAVIVPKGFDVSDEEFRKRTKYLDKLQHEEEAQKQTANQIIEDYLDAASSVVTALRDGTFYKVEKAKEEAQAQIEKERKEAEEKALEQYQLFQESTFASLEKQLEPDATAFEALAISENTSRLDIGVQHASFDDEEDLFEPSTPLDFLHPQLHDRTDAVLGFLLDAVVDASSSSGGGSGGSGGTTISTMTQNQIDAFFGVNGRSALVASVKDGIDDAKRTQVSAGSAAAWNWGDANSDDAEKEAIKKFAAGKGAEFIANCIKDNDKRYVDLYNTGLNAIKAEIVKANASLEQWKANAEKEAQAFNRVARRSFAFSVVLAQTLLKQVMRENAPMLRTRDGYATVNTPFSSTLSNPNDTNAFALADVLRSAFADARNSTTTSQTKMEWLLIGEVAALADALARS